MGKSPQTIFSHIVKQRRTLIILQYTLNNVLKKNKKKDNALLQLTYQNGQ